MWRCNLQNTRMIFYLRIRTYKHLSVYPLAACVMDGNSIELIIPLICHSHFVTEKWLAKRRLSLFFSSKRFQSTISCFAMYSEHLCNLHIGVFLFSETTTTLGCCYECNTKKMSTIVIKSTTKNIVINLIKFHQKVIFHHMQLASSVQFMQIQRQVNQYLCCSIVSHRWIIYDIACKSVTRQRRTKKAVKCVCVCVHYCIHEACKMRPTFFVCLSSVDEEAKACSVQQQKILSTGYMMQHW